MKTHLHLARMSALSYLYDHWSELPAWFRSLGNGQLEDIADQMVKWQLPSRNPSILPIAEMEKREVLRALALCDGSASKAAKLLKIGKSTMWRKLNEWGYSAQNLRLMAQASSLSRRRREPGTSSKNVNRSDAAV